MGNPVTGCECSVDENAPDVTNGTEATVTWTISDCKAGSDTPNGDWKWAWTGATGTSNKATATFTQKDETKTPTVKVTSAENASMNVTCPSAKAVDNTQPDNFSCSVSPKAINLGASFTFTVSGFSGNTYSSSLVDEDGHKLGDGNTSNPKFTITPSKAGVVEYVYTLNGAIGQYNTPISESCTQYVTVTDNSSSWPSKSESFEWGTDKKFGTGSKYSLTYPSDPRGGTQGRLYCRGSASFTCNETSYSGNSEYRIDSSRSGCTTLKVFGSDSLTCAFGSY